MLSEKQLANLRTVITESLRLQESTSNAVEYIDIANAKSDAMARQNHVIFGRRGCGKTLLLLNARPEGKSEVRIIYINMEDYKQHSFPNILVEILDQIFKEMRNNLTAWFGRKKRVRELIDSILAKLETLKHSPDSHQEHVLHKSEAENSDSQKLMFNLPKGFEIGTESYQKERAAIEREYTKYSNKIQNLNLILPEIKAMIREFFNVSSGVKSIIIQIDDFYHLQRSMQPFVADYIHRLCKDVPLYFKIATLKHASTLYVHRPDQPIGAQERHDYQPIDVDFTLSDFKKTASHLKTIFKKFAEKASIQPSEAETLFSDEGFNRLVLSSGGVPRDFLSQFLEILSKKDPHNPKIIKDDVRSFSGNDWNRRKEELKSDSEEKDQVGLIKGIDAIRYFCRELHKTNIFLISEDTYQKRADIRELINRLLDYRIIHFVAEALSRKTSSGSTYRAYMIDIGAYADLRKLQDRFKEIDITTPDVKEQVRTAPVMSEKDLDEIYAKTESN